MTPDAIAWAVVLVGLIALYFVALQVRALNRPKDTDGGGGGGVGARLERSSEHNAKVRAIQEYLADEKIVRTILEERLTSLPVLQQILETIEAVSEDEVSTAVRNLLRNRNVRRVIADYHVKHYGAKYGHTRLEVLKALKEWIEPEDEHEVVPFVKRGESAVVH